MSKLTITGPFTTDEIRRIVALLQDIESMRPTETFNIIADVSDIEGDGAEIFAAMEPPPLSGYQRDTAMSKFDAGVSKAELTAYVDQLSDGPITFKDLVVMFGGMNQ